jgi:aspartokinase/homoserine dehydrogenase 1
MPKNYKTSHTLTEFTLQTQSWFDAKKLSLCRIMRQMKCNFGANILHAKTIIPLLEKIFHSNLNTFNHENKGTLITSNANEGY